MFKHKPGSSNAWRGIVDNVDVLRQGVILVVGNGRGTSFWFDRWAAKHPLIEVATITSNGDNQEMTVQEYWDLNIGWKWEKYVDFLPPTML